MNKLSKVLELIFYIVVWIAAFVVFGSSLEDFGFDSPEFFSTYGAVMGSVLTAISIKILSSNHY